MIEMHRDERDTPDATAVPVPIPPGGLAHVDARQQQQAHLQQMERLLPAEHAALRSSGLQPAYEAAIQILCLSAQIMPTPVQIRAICLRLHAAAVTEKRAKRIAEILIDNGTFDDKVKRFRGEMTPADWIRVNDLFPVRGRHYTKREIDTMTTELRIDGALFQKTQPGDDHLPVYSFVPVAQPGAAQ